MRTGFGSSPWAEVVGVVGDVKHDGLRQDMSQAVYHPYLQVSDGARWLIGEMTFVLRASSSAAAVSTLRGTLQDMSQRAALCRRADARRRREQGVRPALLRAVDGSAVAARLRAGGRRPLRRGLLLRTSADARARRPRRTGARRIDIVSLVLREGLVLVGVGTVLGVAGSYAVTRLLTRFLFLVTATDPSTFVAVPAILAAVSLAACYIPARRATTIDPLRALRYE